MAAYEYQALNPQGKRRKGVIEADSPRQVRQMLREQGLVPVDVVAASGKKTGSDKAQLGSRSRASISTTDMSLLMRQIATLVGSGMPLEESLSVVAQQADKPKVKAVTLGLRSKVLEGHSLATGMADFPKVFTSLYRATTEAGEQSGRLDIVLERLADYAEARQEMRQKSQLALLYPLILTLVAITAVVGLMVFVVPKVIETFETQAVELPLLTRLLIQFSDGLRAHGLVLSIALLLILLGAALLFKQPIAKKKLHQFWLRVPVVRKLVINFNAARFARTLSMLTASGVPVIDALKVSRKVVSNIPMRETVEHAIEQVTEGQSIHKALGRSSHFPPMMLHLIANGEASGELDKMLSRAADNQEREVNTSVSALVGIMEPALILIMGIFVLFIVLAILLPIIQLNTVVS